MIKTVNAVKGQNGSGGTVAVESVADILERELQHLIMDWLPESMNRQTSPVFS
jgi:hypothetical protein